MLWRSGPLFELEEGGFSIGCGGGQVLRRSGALPSQFKESVPVENALVLAKHGFNLSTDFRAEFVQEPTDFNPDRDGLGSPRLSILAIEKLVPIPSSALAEHPELEGRRAKLQVTLEAPYRLEKVIPGLQREVNWKAPGDQFVPVIHSKIVTEPGKDPSIQYARAGYAAVTQEAAALSTDFWSAFEQAFLEVDRAVRTPSLMSRLKHLLRIPA